MEHNRPRGREKHVTGPGKTVEKRGEGLGAGPVGDAGCLLYTSDAADE